MTEKDKLYQAINEVMKEVGYVQKQKGKNLNYSYAGEAGLIQAIRPSMVKHGLLIYPSGVRDKVIETYTTKTGAIMNHIVGEYGYTIAHANSGQSIELWVIGESADVGDKAGNKSMTAAFKYALRQSFMIETGDDPDTTPSQEQERATKTKGNWSDAQVKAVIDNSPAEGRAKAVQWLEWAKPPQTVPLAELELFIKDYVQMRYDGDLEAEKALVSAKENLLVRMKG